MKEVVTLNVEMSIIRVKISDGICCLLFEAWFVSSSLTLNSEIGGSGAANTVIQSDVLKG